MGLIRATTSMLIGSMAIGLTTVSLAAPGRVDASQTPEAQQSPAPGSTARPVGTIKAISGNTITLALDAYPAAFVQIQDSTRILRIAPGQKDLKNAVPMQLPDLQVGDRIAVHGHVSDDGKSVVALSVIVMKATDVAAKQEQDREDWQKRGVGGLVTAIDPSSGNITISTAVIGASKTLTIHASPSTIVRRDSPDSNKVDDAKPSTLGEIKPGDQLRARGTHNTDGREITADEIISGTYRNISGTIASTDPGNNTVSVTDLATKKTVALKINGESQLRKLSPLVAQRIALRLKGEPPAGAPGAAVAGGRTAGGRPGETPTEGSGHSSRPGGAPDFQQMLARMPAVTLADLQKGDAVMIVSTQGTINTPPTAITLLSGVEPILSASPDSGRAAMLLSPWNLGGSGGEAGAGATP